MVSRGAARRAGFTLIELTLALALLAVGLLALIGGLTRALQETETARQGHAALRRLESVADSLAAVGLPASGAHELAGYLLEWRPEACVAGACVRLTARREGNPAESFTVLARVARAGENP